MEDLEKVYKRYFRDVYHYIYSLSRNQHVAEDITSIAFMKAIRKLNDFEGECDIRVWLCQIAKNSYIDYLRKQKKHVSVEVVVDLASPENIEENFEYKDEYMQILHIVESLKQPYKQVFKLRHFAELSYRAIGKEFGRTENWACVVCYRAKAMIKSRMEVDDENQV